METKEIKFMVDSYFDGELEKGNEPVLFSLLSSDTEAREYFKKLNLLKTSIVNSVEEFPQQLDERILRSIESSNQKFVQINIYKNIFKAVAYSVTIILLILTIFFYSKSEEYKVQFNDLTREVKKQNDKLELIMNALPPVDVSGNFYTTRQIIVRPNSWG